MRQTTQIPEALGPMVFLIPLASVFAQHVRLVLRPEGAIPVGEFDRRLWQPAFHIHTPAPDPHKTLSVCPALPNLLLESTMQGRGVHLTPARRSQHFERRAFVVIAFVVGKMRQAIVVPNQVAVDLFSSGDGAGARPGVLAQPLLNANWLSIKFCQGWPFG